MIEIGLVMIARILGCSFEKSDRMDLDGTCGSVWYVSIRAIIMRRL